MNEPTDHLRLRPTTEGDLSFVLTLEHAPENRGLIGQWTVAEHLDSLGNPEREHWIIERARDGTSMGYLIAYDLLRQGLGIYIKRIAVTTPSAGTGRLALRLFLTHAFEESRADSVWLDVYRTNERAQRAYAAVGFSQVANTAFDRALANSLVEHIPEDCLVMRISA